MTKEDSERFGQRLAALEVQQSNVDDRLTGVETGLSEVNATLKRVILLVGNLSEQIVQMQHQWQDDFRTFEHRIQQLIDPLLGRIEEERIEEAVHLEQHRRVETLEDRLAKLEKSHSRGSHATAP